MAEDGDTERNDGLNDGEGVSDGEMGLRVVVNDMVPVQVWLRKLWLRVPVSDRLEVGV